LPSVLVSASAGSLPTWMIAVVASVSRATSAT